jgi:hypothetical protein
MADVGSCSASRGGFLAKVVTITVLAISLTGLARCDRRVIQAGSPSSEWTCIPDVRPNCVEIRLLPNVAVLRRIEGSVNPVGAEGWLSRNRPILAVWSHDNSRLRHQISVRLDGRIAPIDLPEGQYCFQASAIGFGSVVGRIRIERLGPDDSLDVRLPLAN